MRKVSPRDLIVEIGQLADTVRKSGPLALENVQVSDPFLAKGVRYIADGYDGDFIRESLELERDLLLRRLSEGEKIFRSIGDCAPAFGMVGTLIGMVQMFANMQRSFDARSLYGHRADRDALRRAGAELHRPSDRRQAAPEIRRGGPQPDADHRRHPADPRCEEPGARARDAAGLPAREAPAEILDDAA